MEPSEAALRVDRELEEIQASYDLLELLRPINLDEAWEEFRSGGYEDEPHFEYPGIPVDPSGLRERLHALDFSGIDDSSLLYFLTAKRDELELELRLLGTRNRATFLAGSIRLYGPVQQELLRAAEEILESVDSGDGARAGEMLSSEEVRGLVDAELEHYHSMDSSFSAQVRVRSDHEGFVAEEGDLLFPEDIELPARRARALVQHEIGVHIVTYHNGVKQPLRLLRSGLSSYDELQEAFGALSEHLVGGLTAARMRTLAARVLAARMTEHRTHFVDIFRRLTREYGFSDSGAFHITARVHQSGGFTRDQIYLRGLRYLLNYLSSGGELKPLYLGKLGHAEIPIIQDLRRRGVLREPPLRPRFLEMQDSAERLERLRERRSVVALVEG